jgi:hypothetical protein
MRRQSTMYPGRWQAAILVCLLLRSGAIANAASPLDPGAVCGNGILEPGEDCDAGAGNGTDDCCSTACRLVDRDVDGTCDAIDPCADGIYIKDSKLRITRLSTPPGDDRLRFAGTVTIPNEMNFAPPIDPATSGVRLRMFTPGFDPHGSAVMDASIPGGSQWTHLSAAAWRYRDPTGVVGGITRVKVKLLPPLVPTTHLTRVAFEIHGRRGDYPLTPDVVDSNLQVTLSLVAPGDASNRQCGSVFYTPAQRNRCGLGASHDTLACAGPPPVGPCHVGDPNDLVVCDVVNAAHAEDAYFAAHGTYYSGPCTGLPGFVASPGVSCSAAGIATAFSIATAGATPYVCIWTSNAPPITDKLVCS